jgi:hypothetical protein
MQKTFNRKGYLAFSISLTTTAATLAALVLAQLNILLAGSYREVQIQVDPETSGSLSVRLGDGSLGTTIGGKVQKGVTLVGGSAADTYRGSGANAIYTQMLNLQAVTSEPIVNVQLWEE